MEKTFNKYFWIVNLVILALLAFFIAGGVGELVAANISTSMPTTSSTTTIKKTRITTMEAPFVGPDGTVVLERNIFDSVTGPLLPLEPVVSDVPDDIPQALPGELPIVPCPGNTNSLVATVASSNHPDWSFATIASGATVQLYRIGDEVGSRTVSGIGWRHVLLRGTTDECYISLFADPNKKPGLPPAKPSRVAARPVTDDSIKHGITSISDTEKIVERSVVDQALANPTKFASSVRVRPYRKNGKVDGFRIRRVQKDSPLSLLGAQRGDIIHSINGIQLTGVDKALSAYQSLRNESKLTFKVTRKGKPTDLVVNIQ